MRFMFQLSPKPLSCLIILLIWSFGASSLSGQVFTSELPILVFGIAADSVPAEEKDLVTLQIASNSEGRLNSSAGPFTHYDGFAGIENRGSTSLSFPKRGYAIELRTAGNVDLDFALLGMPEEEDWVLHGPFSDKSLLRNAFTYNLAQSTSTWAPRSRFCTVVFENDYRGVFLLTERVKRDKNRLDIANLKEDDIEGLQLTGGYILKVDKVTAEDVNVEYDFSLPVVDAEHNISTQLIYHDPKPELITEEQKEYIQSWMEEFESRLAGRDCSDEQFGFQNLIDFDSWIDFFFINEITRNVDGYRLRTYMHKRRDDNGGTLHMGHVRDFNLALGNAY